MAHAWQIKQRRSREVLVKAAWCDTLAATREGVLYWQCLADPPSWPQIVM